MRPIHAIAAAVIAFGALGLSAPADAAPRNGPAVAAFAGDVVQVGHRDRGDDRKWHRDRDRRGDWRGDRKRRGDWNRDRGRHSGWDRGKHRGWERGRGHDKHWRDDRRDKRGKFSAKKHKRWHARKHPRHRHWHGRHFPRVKYVVIRDYDRYYLPPPRRGHFYARVDNDVFLVAEGTKRIIDAFVLFDAVGR